MKISIANLSLLYQLVYRVFGQSNPGIIVKFHNSLFRISYPMLHFSNFQNAKAYG